MTDTDALARNFSDTQVVLRGIAAARRDHGQPGPEQTWKELRRRCEIVLEDDRKALEFLFRQRVELMQGEQVGDSACDIAAMFTAQGVIEQAAFDDRQYWHRSTIERGRRLLPKRRGNESRQAEFGYCNPLGGHCPWRSRGIIGLTRDIPNSDVDLLASRNSLL